LAEKTTRLALKKYGLARKNDLLAKNEIEKPCKKIFNYRP
jgi:hypothetical protein